MAEETDKDEKASGPARKLTPEAERALAEAEARRKAAVEAARPKSSAAATDWSPCATAIGRTRESPAIFEARLKPSRRRLDTEPPDCGLSCLQGAGGTGGSLACDEPCRDVWRSLARRPCRRLPRRDQDLWRRRSRGRCAAWRRSRRDARRIPDDRRAVGLRKDDADIRDHGDPPAGRRALPCART